MEKIAKTLQLALMCIILVSTVIAVGMEIKNMFLLKNIMTPVLSLCLKIIQMVRLLKTKQNFDCLQQSQLERPGLDILIPASHGIL